MYFLSIYPAIGELGWRISSMCLAVAGGFGLMLWCKATASAAVYKTKFKPVL